MSEFTKDLMRQLRFISSASNAFMSTRQKLTGQQRVLAILVKEDGLTMFCEKKKSMTNESNVFS